MPPFDVQPISDSRKVIDKRQAEVEISREVDVVTVYMANGSRSQMSMVVKFVRRVDVDGSASYVDDGQVTIGQDLLLGLSTYEEAYQQVIQLAHAYKDAADAAVADGNQPTVVIEPPPEIEPADPAPLQAEEPPTGDENPPQVSSPPDLQIIDLDRDRVRPTAGREQVNEPRS